MDERARRVGRNEAIFRELNEQIEALNRELSDRKMHVVCECADLRCSERIVVSIEDYEDVRADDTHFLIVPGHERLDVEDVIETTAAYNVVRKHEGDAARLARDLSRR